MEGIDCAERAPAPAALKRNGKLFVARYLSGYASKDLSLAEAKQLSAGGIGIVVVWERGANDATGNANAGVSDAKAASKLAASKGMPGDRPIFFAVDFDAEGPECAEYFRGVKSVLGWRAGVYGGKRVVSYLFDHHLVGWAWQTYAWSGGLWDGRAHLRQYSNDHVVAGVSCDLDRGVFADFGQWRIGWSPAKGNPYPVLRHGSKGADVMRLSRNLHFLHDPENKNRAYYAPDWRVPFPGLPFFTKGLEAAVATFQFRHHHPRTGVLDRATWDAIGAAIQAQKHHH